MDANIYLQVEALLTQHERERFLATVVRFIPGLRGAHVADVLSMMHDHDFCLALSEPAYEALRDQVREPKLIGPVSIAAWFLHSDFDPDKTTATVATVREILTRVS